MKFSVIIPTHNRAKLLLYTLESIKKLNFNFNEFEILIIDNQSTDGTKTVVFNSLQDTNLNWKYFYLSKAGLHYARNKGIKEARGEIVIFADDDVIVTNNWLSEYEKEFENNPLTGIAGGRILPKWEISPPQWIYDYGNEKIHGVFAYLDLGNKRQIIKSPMLMGANFAIRRELAIEIGGSPPDTFPKHLIHLSGTGETEMQKMVMHLGYNVVYLPNPTVYHFAPKERMTYNYFIYRHKRWAIEAVYSDVRHNQLPRLKLFYLLFRRYSRKLPKILKHYLKGYYKKQYINPTLKFRIDVLTTINQIKQITRILFSQKLYSYIKKTTYLDEV